MNRGIRVLQTLALPLGYVTSKVIENVNFKHSFFSLRHYYITIIFKSQQTLIQLSAQNARRNDI